MREAVESESHTNEELNDADRQSIPEPTRTVHRDGDSVPTIQMLQT